MTFNLKAMTVKELKKLKTDVAKALNAAEDRARREALKAVEKAAAEFGYALVELTPEKKTRTTKKGTKAKPRAKAKPKYRNPADPTQTWSGRGRKPLWINEALANGADITDLEI